MSSSPSFLDAVGRSILKSADSIDAHIDADALVERLTSDTSSDFRRARKALGELKGLARRAPTAVATAKGAVPAVLRLVVRLIPSGNEEESEDNAEPLQDALEALGCLVGVAAPNEDEATRHRGEEVAELIVRHTTNGKDLLRILGLRDISTKYDAMVVLQRIYRRLPGPIDTALLADPRALGDVMEVFQGCQIDYIRNECLSLLLLLTETNGDIQKIVTFQGLVDTVFSILEEEDLTAGGKVARDLLRCFANLVGNSMCQRHIRETGGISSLVSALGVAVSGRRGHEAEEDEDDDLLGANARADVPEEARWACLKLLMDAALALVGRRGRGGGAEEEPQPELKANQDVFIRAGALGLCRHIADFQVDLPAKLKLVELLEALEPNVLAAQQLQSYQAEEPPLLFALTTVVLGPTTSLPLRCALGRVLGRSLARHASLQSFLCSSFRPELEPPPGAALPAGRQIVEVMEDAAQARAEPEQLWFALHFVLAMLLGNASVQAMAVSMPVAIPNDAGPAEGFLDLLRRMFSSCARTASAPGGGDGAPTSAAPKGPEGAAALVATLKLLLYWTASCPEALAPFASSAVMVPLTMDLITVGAGVGPFLQVQVEGLAALLMGVCIKAEDGDVDVAALMALLAKRVGIEEFQQRVERFWRSEVLQRPPRGLADFRWHGSRFRAFVREQQRSVQRRMVQLYVAEGTGVASGALSEDVADDYKQLIRVQDSQLREVRRENEQLRGEVEEFMQRSLQAASFAVVDKVSALEKENEALHTEVEQLSRELDERSAQAEHERGQLRASVAELEQQLRSMAVGYEQVEQTSEGLARENARLRAALEVRSQAGAVGAGAEREGMLEREAAAARQRAEELQADRSDLLELLGRIISACPDAARFVAPLGAQGVPSRAEAVAAEPAMVPAPTLAAAGVS